MRFDYKKLPDKIINFKFEKYGSIFFFTNTNKYNLIISISTAAGRSIKINLILLERERPISNHNFIFSNIKNLLNEIDKFLYFCHLSISLDYLNLIFDYLNQFEVLKNVTY